jgi:hypothetical protein
MKHVLSLYLIAAMFIIGCKSDQNQNASTTVTQPDSTIVKTAQADGHHQTKDDQF